jgi:hypothetical protein
MTEHTLPTHKHFRNLIGRRFGRLLVTSFAGMVGTAGSRTRASWVCTCDCGATVQVFGNRLATGNTTSCGCRKREIQNGSVRVTHGLKHTLEYGAWTKMKSRCFNSHTKSFPRYGGRGITVCDRWLTFANFISDMGMRPTTQHTIERIDNNGNYCPENCRWATRSEQNVNQERNRKIEFNGKVLCLSEWAAVLGINHGTLVSRMDRNGWSVERAFTTPPRQMRFQRHV